MNRRELMAAMGGTAAVGLFSIGANAEPVAKPSLSVRRPFVPFGGPRSRVVFVNDLSGDVDGLFAAVHQILTPTAQLRAIVGTAAGGGKDETAGRSVELANEILRLMGRTGQIPVHVGAAAKMAKAGEPVRSQGTQAIIDEALRSDQLPLYIAVGGGLTEVASAVLLEPRIAERFTLVWIGGDALPGGGTGETNFNLDPLAAQYLFNETTVPIWQLPRAVYQTCIVSATEIEAFVAPYGRIGSWLYEQLYAVPRRFQGKFNTGETWTLGDSPLAALTGLHDWVPSEIRPALRYQRTGSSEFDDVVAPRLAQDGSFNLRSEGRKIRVYKTIDTRLMFNDFFAKMRVNYPG